MKLDAWNLRPCLNLQSSNALNMVGANSSTSQLREGTVLLSSSRRTFLQSLSKSALVLSLDSVLALARPLRPHAFFQAAAGPAKPAAGLGLSFLNVARDVRTERENHLRRRAQEQISVWRPPVAALPFTTTTTTAGWIFFWSTAGAWKASLPDRNPRRIFSRIIATALLPTSPPKPAWRTPAGDRASASATMTTTASRICSSPTSARTFSTTTTGTARLPTSAKRPASRGTASAGTPAAPLWTTTATASSICSSPTTSTSIWRQRRSRSPVLASTRV